MAFKILAGVIAMVLAILYLGAPLIKLKDWALGSVIMLGLVLMVIDLWQSVRSKDD